jgi:hypothetical protein
MLSVVFNDISWSPDFRILKSITVFLEHLIEPAICICQFGGSFLWSGNLHATSFKDNLLCFSTSLVWTASSTPIGNTTKSPFSLIFSATAS